MRTQEKINVALSLLSQMTNDLAMLNLQMALLPSSGQMSEKFQKDREDAHSEFAEDIIRVANKLGDYFNSLDLSDEDYLERINPQFEFINEPD